jgi:putative ABC transport system permease protein
VSATAIATRLPFDVNAHFALLFPDRSRVAAGEAGIATDMSVVEPAYFATLGVPLLRGRGFDDRDAPEAPPVAIVNRAMAERYWGSAEAAVGSTFRVGDATAPAVTVVGVVADHKVRTIGEAPRPLVHFPLAQRPSTYAYLLARSRGDDALPLVEPLRRLALDLDPEVALTGTTTLAEMMAVSLYPVRTAAILLASFGLLALALAGVGLYGVIASMVARRQREMGIRLAVGADRATLLRLVVGQGMRLVATGVLLGAATALAVTRLLAGVLHGVSALDPPAFVAAAGILALAGLAANLVPAARAAGADAMAALRGQ